MALQREQRRWRPLITLWWILVAVFGSVADGITTDLDEMFGPNIVSVTSNSVTILVPCLQQKTCVPKRLIFQKLNGTVELNETTLQPLHRITNLTSKTVYEVKTTVNVNGTDIEKKRRIWTCPVEVPAIGDIRTAKAGPGWLDLRWPTVRDIDCDSHIFYLVQYAAESAENEVVFSPEKKYGIIAKNEEKIIFRPLHPCAAWDEEYCLLLTDYVKPGKNHTVRVKPVRFDYYSSTLGALPATSEITKTYTTNVYADPTVMGPYTLGQADAKSPCNSLKMSPAVGEINQNPDTNLPEKGRGFSQQPIRVPVWIIVLAVLLLLCSLVFLLTAWIWKKKRSKSRNELLSKVYPATSSPPACSEYVDRASEMYDDCDTIVNPQSGINPATTTHQNVVPDERLKGWKSSHPKMNGIEAIAKVGNGDKGGMAINKQSATDHYVPMQPQLIYDDARGLVGNVPETSYCNLPSAARDSNVYMEPTSPIYDVAKFVAGRESKASTAYNEVYSHSPGDPWRSWQ